MDTTITCLACGHAHAVANDTGLAPDAFFAAGIFRCDECGARMAYGRLMPRIVVEPFTDESGRRWLRRRIQDRATGEEFAYDVDPQYAAMEAKNVLSLVIP